MTTVNILEPIQIASLIIGAMMPYAFSALTMKSVGSAAEKMVTIRVNLSARKLNTKLAARTEKKLLNLTLTAASKFQLKPPSTK